MSSKQTASIDESTPTAGRTVANGACREQVFEIQRTRILAALAEVIGERGAAKLTVAHIVARSGVSRRTFYEMFLDRDDCVLAALEDAIARIAAVVVPAYEEPDGWCEQMRAGLIALLELLSYEPGIGRLVIVEALGAGPRALECREAALARVIAAVDVGRARAKQGEGLSPMAAEGVVGGVLAVLHSRLLGSPPVAGGPGVDAPPSSSSSSFEVEESLLGLTSPLMSMIVLPYLGAAAARKELARPAPECRVRQRAGPADPLRDLGMRLTYRTVRVLMAVAELGVRGSPPSNREVGAAAGMSDQGQTSKLLTRLSKLGLVENGPTGLARGAPNAWMLTSKGAEVERAIGHGTG